MPGIGAERVGKDCHFIVEFLSIKYLLQRIQVFLHYLQPSQNISGEFSSKIFYQKNTRCNTKKKFSLMRVWITLLWYWQQGYRVKRNAPGGGKEVSLAPFQKCCYSSCELFDKKSWLWYEKLENYGPNWQNKVVRDSFNLRLTSLLENIFHGLLISFSQSLTISVCLILLFRTFWSVEFNFIWSGSVSLRRFSIFIISWFLY